MQRILSNDIGGYESVVGGDDNEQDSTDRGEEVNGHASVKYSSAEGIWNSESSEETASEAYSTVEICSDSFWESLQEREGKLEKAHTSPDATNEFCDDAAASQATSSEVVLPAADVSDTSTGHESEKCSICLANLTAQECGTPGTCDHTFCTYCLPELAQNISIRPVDRQMFNFIFARRHLLGEITRVIPSEKPRRKDYCENLVL
jgi:hypothetical protein